MQGGESYRLVVRRGPQPNQVYELKDDVLNLGRDITNTITINDREVSRHHLRFTRGAEGFTLEDLGSTNGTFINGKRLTGAILLKSGDMIGLGETVTLGYEMVRPGGMVASPSPSVPANPYQAPQSAPPASASPYQPPSQPANPFQAPAQPASPYQAPAQPSNPYQAPAPVDPYQQPSFAQQPDPYQQPSYGAPADPQGYFPPQQQGYGAPPPPGYDYDPYAMREQEGRNPMRMVLFGCLGLMLFCCCFTIVAVVLVDTLNLYCQIPLVNSILQALGLIRCVVG